MRLGSCQSMFAGYGNAWAEKMKEYGFDYVDYYLDGELRGQSEEAYRGAFLEQVARARDAGVTIWQLHGPWRYPPRDGTEEEREERFSVMRRSIELCGAAGCPYWVIHPLMPFGAGDDGDLARFREINLSHFRRLLPVAHDSGVTICFENMPMRGLSISTPEQTLAFVQEMDDPAFQFCLDTGHSIVMGQQPAEAVRMAGSHLRVMHVHDNDGTRDAHQLPTTGIIDWRAYRQALREIGFDGVFSIEMAAGDIEKLLPHATHETRLRVLRLIADEITGD